MIPESRKILRWFGERPWLCLFPLGGMALLTAGHLYTGARYGERFVVEPFGYLAALTLVLATLALLAVALAWWVRRHVAIMLDRLYAEVLAVKATLDEMSKPAWARRTATHPQVSPAPANPRITYLKPNEGHVYGQSAVGQHQSTEDFTEVLERNWDKRNLELDGETSGDVMRRD